MREGPVVLFFYPGDRSSVVTDQMGSFEERGAKVPGISADTPRSHRTRGEDRGVKFPLLSDLSSLDDQAEVDAVLEGLEKAL